MENQAQPIQLTLEEKDVRVEPLQPLEGFSKLTGKKASMDASDGEADQQNA